MTFVPHVGTYIFPPLGTKSARSSRDTPDGPAGRGQWRRPPATFAPESSEVTPPLTAMLAEAKVTELEEAFIRLVGMPPVEAAA